LCSQGVRRFEGKIQFLNSQLMSEEEYNAGVLADVQQAQQIVAAFLEAKSFKGLLHNVSDISACLYITICTVTAQKPGQCQQSTWFQCMD